MVEVVGPPREPRRLRPAGAVDVDDAIRSKVAVEHIHVVADATFENVGGRVASATIQRVVVGAGVNGRSSQTPIRNPPGIVAPGYLTYDLFAEYAFSRQITLKLNANNVTNKLYADSLYTGHYVPGQPRTLYASMTARF